MLFVRTGSVMTDVFGSGRGFDADDRLADCEKILDYRFRDRMLLQRCLTHSSIASTRLDSNERLEFLGDAVLGLVVCESLFRRYPKAPEGELTRWKSVLVSGATCARISERLGLNQVLALGKGLRERHSVPVSIRAAVLEAVIAGIYLDGGIDSARTFIERVLADELKGVTEESCQNFKSLLQQLSQKRFSETPRYDLIDEKGPDHSKCFKIAAAIGSRSHTAAWGASKKEAEQRAAENALSELEGRPVAHPDHES
jgi:ribonuclease-3